MAEILIRNCGLYEQRSIPIKGSCTYKEVMSIVNIIMYYPKDTQTLCAYIWGFEKRGE